MLGYLVSVRAFRTQTSGLGLAAPWPAPWPAFSLGLCLARHAPSAALPHQRASEDGEVMQPAWGPPAESHPGRLEPTPVCSQSLAHTSCRGCSVLFREICFRLSTPPPPPQSPTAETQPAHEHPGPPAQRRGARAPWRFWSPGQQEKCHGLESGPFPSWADLVALGGQGRAVAVT